MKKPKIAVIGAGWAGLSAAAHLVEHADVALYEAGRVAGGRARGVSGDAFSFLDNGQHLLIGAYQGVFRLLRRYCLSLWTICARASSQMNNPAKWLPQSVWRCLSAFS